MIYKSALMTQASGSVGGVTASHNRGGQYFRARVIPVNPGTPEQQRVRDILTGLAIRWGEKLSSAQRDTWDTYAANVPVINRLGDSVFLTGLNHYIRSNVGRFQAGLSFVDDAPSTFNLGTFTAPTITATVLTQAVTVAFDNADDWAGETDSAMLGYLSRPAGHSIHYFQGPYRYAGKIEGDDVTPPASPAPLIAPYAFAADQKLFGFFRVVRVDGRCSAPYRLEQTTV
jgi:hypothetical protein